MNRQDFEQAARDQNRQKSADVAAARESNAPCVVVDMFAFDSTFCSTHHVMGNCPFGKEATNR